MRVDRSILEYQVPEAPPVPFRPGLRALAAVAFAGAVYLAFFTVVAWQRLRLPVTEMRPLYLAVALGLLGVLFFRLAYRRPGGGAG